jgi:DNA helicase-2/ATP-dependent DNA helicase PcrA
MTRVGYISMLEEGDKSDRDRIDNILELKTHINNYLENAEEPSLGNYLEECALLMDVDKYDDEVNAVVLMTIHSAKGLEFPVVFLPGMEEGVFPGKKVLELSDPTELEEERRLAYVAITRAKERLFILHAKQRMLYGQTGQNELSRFAVAIPEELIRREDLTLEAMSAASTVVTGKPAGTPAGQSYGYYERPRRPRAPVHTDRLTVGQPVPAATTEARQNMNALAPGDRVTHASFGEGEILSIKPMGADKLIEVMFDTAGTKKLMGTYAKLKKLEE